MRLSRKAGLIACGVKWIKYACTRNVNHQDGYEFAYSETAKESGTNSDVWFQGTTSFKTTFNGTEYVYEPLGDQSHVSVDKPGTVYQAYGTMLEIYTVYSNGYYTIKIRTLSTFPKYVYDYSVGEEIGSVRSAKDKYPDEKNGYRYVTVYDGYTIMNIGADFYAYEVAPSPEPAKFTARIQDDVLVVRGNGVATIENGVLYVR